MCSILRITGCMPLIFPRAGALIDQVKDSKILLWLARILSNSFSGFLCQGDSFRSFAIHNLRLKSDIVHVIPNWTATDKFLKVGSDRIYTFRKPRKIKLLFIGWVIEAKGVFELIEALKILERAGTEVELVIVGNGVAKKKAEQHVLSKNLRQSIKFTGWLTEDELIPLLAESDIFVLPSQSEGFPNSMIEALAAGLAVIVSNVGAISDFVKDGETALLIDSQNPSEIAEAVLKLVCDEELRLKLAKNGHKLARDLFSSKRAVFKLESLIEKYQNKTK